MIIAGQLLLTDEGTSARIEPGYVRLDGERIAEVAVGSIPTVADAGGTRALIAPGFIDAHTHLPQFDMIGAHGLTLLKWLEQVTFPEERKWEDVTVAAAATERAIDQFFSHGTTGICAYATVHHQGTIAALNSLRSRGMRGLVGQTLIDRNAPDYLVRSPFRQIEETAALLDKFPPGSRVSAAVTPRFAISCSPELLAAAGDLAFERNAHVQSHLAETATECSVVSDLFDGIPYTQVYRNAGLLTERTLLGHCIHLDDDDRDTLRDTKAVAVHCPTANFFLLSGIMDRRRHVEAAVRMALGSDIGAGYERSMVRTAKVMMLAASVLGDNQPSAAEAWWQITAGNAKAVGWNDAGVLRKGDPADVVLIDPDVDWLNGASDPLSRLLFSWDDRWLRRSWAQGRPVYGGSR